MCGGGATIGTTAMFVIAGLQSTGATIGTTAMFVAIRSAVSAAAATIVSACRNCSRGG